MSSSSTVSPSPATMPRQRFGGVTSVPVEDGDPVAAAIASAASSDTSAGEAAVLVDVGESALDVLEVFPKPPGNSPLPVVSIRMDLLEPSYQRDCLQRLLKEFGSDVVLPVAGPGDRLTVRFVSRPQVSIVFSGAAVGLRRLQTTQSVVWVVDPGLRP